MTDTRDFKSLGIWGEDAETTIPITPLPGVAYRNTAFPQIENEEGEQYNSIPDSANLNQAMFIITSSTDTIEHHGTLGWYSLVDYDPLPALTWASDGKFYTALQPSGPNTGAGARDPAVGANPDYWQELISSNILELDLSSQDFGDEGARQVGTTFQPDTTDFPVPVGQTVQDTLEFVDERAYKLQNLRLVFAGTFDESGILQGQGFNIKNNKADKITNEGQSFFRIDLDDKRFYSLLMEVVVTPLRQINNDPPVSGTSILTANKFVIIGPWKDVSGTPVVDDTDTIKIQFTNPFNINEQLSLPFTVIGTMLDSPTS